MTLYEMIKKELEKSPKARQRKNKNKFIAWLLSKKYEVQTGINTDKLADLIVDAGSYDRLWRQVLQMEPQLRGDDYSDKDVLESEKILDLDYQPGVVPVIKKVGEIAKPYKD